MNGSGMLDVGCSIKVTCELPSAVSTRSFMKLRLNMSLRGRTIVGLLWWPVKHYIVWSWLIYLKLRSTLQPSLRHYSHQRPFVSSQLDDRHVDIWKCALTFITGRRAFDFFPFISFFSLSRSLALLLLIIYASVIGSGSQITFNCLSLNSSNCFAEQEYPAVI